MGKWTLSSPIGNITHEDTSPLPGTFGSFNEWMEAFSILIFLNKDATEMYSLRMILIIYKIEFTKELKEPLPLPPAKSCPSGQNRQGPVSPTATAVCSC